MCDSVAVNRINEIVTKLIKDEKTFSAFDVTKLLRKEGISIFHNEVKKEVDNLYRYSIVFADYYRASVEVLNSVKAFIYIPVGNSDDYEHDWIEKEDYSLTAVKQPIYIATDTIDTSTNIIDELLGDATTGNELFGNVTSDCRIEIPKRLLDSLITKNAGCTTFSLFVGPDSIIISTSDDIDNVDFHYYGEVKCDGNDRLRLNLKSLLSEIAIDNWCEDVVVFSMNDNQITVYPSYE